MQHKLLLERYFQAANAHHISNTLQFFADDAVVYDEGETHCGKEAIRHWLESTNAKYSTHYTLVDITEEKNGVTTVTASVSGTFPGSPIQLSSRFTIENGSITSLTCGI